jgi:hypothetical protein
MMRWWVGFEQGYPYKPGYNIAEFLLDTVVIGGKTIFSLDDDDDDHHSMEGGKRPRGEGELPRCE